MKGSAFPIAISATLLLAAFPIPARSQNPPDSRTLSLDQALSAAFTTSEQLRIAQAGLARAEADVARARSGYLPAITGNLAVTRMLQNEFATLPLPGDLDHRYEIGLGLAQPLFTGGRVTGFYRIGDAARRSAQVELASAAAQLTLTVTQAYFDAALADRLVLISEAVLAQADTTLLQTRTANRIGNQSDFDLLRAEVARDNERSVVIQRRVDRDLAHLRLKKLLDISADEPLELLTELEDSVQDVGVFMRNARYSRVTTDVRAPVQQAAEGVRIAEAQVLVARSQLLPSVALVSQYGRFSMAGDRLPAWSEFRSNWTAGVALSVPLFAGGRIRAEIAAAQADLATARARYDQIHDFAEIDTRAAFDKLRAAEAAWQASASTVEQARRAYGIAEVRYREGVSSQLELADARLLLQQAQINRARAASDLRVAQVRVQLIHELPIEQ